MKNVKKAYFLKCKLPLKSKNKKEENKINKSQRKMMQNKIIVISFVKVYLLK